MAKAPPRSFWNPNRLGPSMGFTKLKYNRSYQEVPFGRAGGSHGHQYAAKHGALFIFAATYNNARGAKGWYTQFIEDQRQMNRDTALEYQEIVVRNITEDIAAGGRRAVSTGRLLNVTRDARNVKSSEDFWVVGIMPYLDTSQAKYWRTQEEGTQRAWKRSFIGDPLIGVWGGTIGPFAGGSAGPPFTSAGANRSGKFLPYKRELRRQIAMSGAQVARVAHHIQPMWAYRDAWEQIGGSDELAYRMFATIPGLGPETEVGSHRHRPRYPRGSV